MDERRAERRVLVLAARPALGEIMTSYLRSRFPQISVEHRASPEDKATSAVQFCAVLIVDGAGQAMRDLPRTIRQLRRDHPQASILVATAYPSPSSAVGALLNGAQAFIPRLTPLAAVADALRDVLQPADSPYDGPSGRRAQWAGWVGPERRGPAGG